MDGCRADAYLGGGGGTGNEKRGKGLAPPGGTRKSPARQTGSTRYEEKETPRKKKGCLLGGGKSQGNWVRRKRKHETNKGRPLGEGQNDDKGPEGVSGREF